MSGGSILRSVVKSDRRAHSDGSRSRDLNLNGIDRLDPIFEPFNIKTHRARNVSEPVSDDVVSFEVRCDLHQSLVVGGGGERRSVNRGHLRPPSLSGPEPMAVADPLVSTRSAQVDHRQFHHLMTTSR
jgi:hypothetical protein